MGNREWEKKGGYRLSAVSVRRSTGGASGTRSTAGQAGSGIRCVSTRSVLTSFAAEGGNDVGKRNSIDQAHRIKVHAAIASDAVDIDDVAVIQLAGRKRFVLES